MAAIGEAITDVRELAPARAPDAVAVLNAAFADGPNFTYVFPRPEQRERVLEQLFRASLGDALRHGVVVSVERNGSLAGVALWHPPGGFPVSARRELRMAPSLVRVATAAPGSIGRLARLNHAVVSAIPDEEFWYLQAIGVAPEAQGLGVGRALIEHGVALAHRDRAPAYLETFAKRSAEWYTGFGFEPLRDGVPAIEDGPPFWTMIRRPS
jgi:GNAT superfamily N-acetyltransferase